MRGRPLRHLLPWMAPPVAALLAILPMLRHGPSCGHDFDFHLLSWLEAATQIGHGAYPHWAFTPAFNAGEPRFIFYPPLSWLLGALLGLMLPHLTASPHATTWTGVPIAFIWLALTLAGWTFFRLARRYTGAASATLAATFYLANPYMLFTAYERSAFAELLAAAWLPLLLAAALPGPQPQLQLESQTGPRPAPPGPWLQPSAPRQIIRIALPLTLIWLTNAPAGVMFTYGLAFITLVRLLAPVRSAPGFPAPSRLRLALTTMAGTALGLALAAFYIVPAAYERRFVQISMVVMEGMRVNDHFLFHRMPGHTPDDLFHDAVVRTASWIALSLLAGIVAALPLALRRPGRVASPSQVLLPLALLTAAIALLLTPLSLPLWHLLPQMQFLQFPWRLGSLLGAIFALAGALALPRRLPLLPAAALGLPLLAACMLVFPAYTAFQQACDAEDAVPARVALFHSSLGTESTDEYTPAAADPDALHPHDPPWWLLPSTGQPADLNASATPDAAPGPAPAHLDLTLPAPAYLILNRRDYPQWQIFRNQRKVTDVPPEREDGLIVIMLPAGVSHIDLNWREAADQRWGEVLSGAAFAVLLFTWAAGRSSPASRPPA